MWASKIGCNYSHLQYIRREWEFCLFVPILYRTVITHSILVQLVWKLVSPVCLVNVKGTCNSEFWKYKIFWSSPEGWSNILTRLSMERLGDNLSVWIYYSVLLGTVSRGWHSQFFSYGSSILSLEAVIHFDGSFTAPSIVHARSICKLYKKPGILVPFYLKGMP